MNKQKSGRYRKAVFIVVYTKEKEKIIYLLLKRKLHWKGWEFPKGGIEKNERIFDAARREVREETGQKKIILKDHHIIDRYRYNKAYQDRPGIVGQSYVLFSAELKNKKIKIDKKEHSSYKWLDFKRAIKLLTYLNQKKCLKIVNKEIVK